MPRLERAQAVDLAVVGGLTLLALALRLPLMRDSLLGDELIMYGIVHDHGPGDEGDSSALALDPPHHRCDARHRGLDATLG